VSRRSQSKPVVAADGLSTNSQDLKKEFIEHLIYPAVQANAIYEVRSISQFTSCCLVLGS